MMKDLDKTGDLPLSLLAASKQNSGSAPARTKSKSPSPAPDSRHAPESPKILLIPSPAPQNTHHSQHNSMPLISADTESWHVKEQLVNSIVRQHGIPHLVSGM